MPDKAAKPRIAARFCDCHIAQTFRTGLQTPSGFGQGGTLESQNPVVQAARPQVALGKRSHRA